VLNKVGSDGRGKYRTGSGMLTGKSKGKNVLVRGSSRKKDDIKMYFRIFFL
jgi:hypothetical protein